MTIYYDFLIVGAGQSGAQVATALRRQNLQASIAIVGEEPDLPYDRPPLSKEYLSGQKNFAQLIFRDALAWEQLKVSLLLGQRAVAVDVAARKVSMAAGLVLRYGQLVWSAGGSPRRLSCAGSDLSGVHTIRNRADVDRIASEMPGVREVAIVGGGYIGLEAAAVFTALGKRVTVLEALDRVLARVAGEPLSRFYEGEHRARGVDVRLGSRVERFVGDAGRVCAVQLADGTIPPAQLVIVAIGITPSVQPLLDAGAEGTDGVRVDPNCRTSLPNIFATGDCAEHRNRYAGGNWARIESVQNANDQAVTAANALCGREVPYGAVPWFWSNQYDLKLQTVGLSRGFDDLVIRGEPEERSFSVVYLRGSRVIALDCVNAVRDYSHGKALVMGDVRVDRAKVGDPAVTLKSLLAMQLR